MKSGFDNWIPSIIIFLIIVLPFFYYIIKARLEDDALERVRSKYLHEINVNERKAAKILDDAQRDADNIRNNMEYQCKRKEVQADRRLREIEQQFKEKEEQFIKKERQLDDQFKKKEEQLDDQMSEREFQANQLVTSAELIRDEALDFAPFLAKLYAESRYVYDQEIAKYLENKQRPAYTAAENVRRISAEKRELTEKYKLLSYQLAVYESVFPWLSDFSEATTADLLSASGAEQDYSSEDPTRKYISPAEWKNLTEAQRNQLALDRYNESHKKSSWQIGRDYELYVGYRYTLKGYQVDYTGSLLRLDDLGRDLIARKAKSALVIQCKYWSKEKVIHEKHIFQLFGTGFCYAQDHPGFKVECLLITNTKCSPRAHLFAKQTGIILVEDFEMGQYPQIKCNVSASGERIYHLPMDQQYDSTVISKPDECFAFTVAEAESKGFRRAFKWHG